MIKAVIHPIRPTFMQYANGKNGLKRNGLKSQRLTFRRSMEHPKIDNARKVFLRDFIGRFAVPAL
jgi:hypothetical protein